MNPNLYNLICCDVYVVLILLIGYTALCAACAAVQSGVRHWAELVGLSFGAGAGILSLLLFAVSISGAKPSRLILIAIAIIALAILIYLGRRKSLVRGSVPSPRRKVDVLTPLGLIGLVLIIAAFGNVAARAGWPGLNDTDVFGIWLFKAKWVSLAALRPIPAVFLDPTLSYSHQDYPLSLPFLVAGFYAVIGRVDDTATKLLCLPIYLSLVAIIYAAVRRMHRRALALCITAIFVSAPTLCQNAGLMVAETPLLLALAGAGTLLLRWLELGQAGDLIFAFLFAAIAAFTKNEGLAMLGVFGTASLLPAITRRRLKDWLIAAAMSAVAIGPWLIYRTQLPKTHENYGGKLTDAPTVIHNLHRLGYIMPAYLGRLLDGPEVGLIWYVLIIVALLGMRGFLRSSVKILWCILLVELLLYLGTFVVTPWDLAVLVPKIAPKLLTQASVIAVLLIALHLREMRWAGSDKSS